jgi:hypothetical protein
MLDDSSAYFGSSKTLLTPAHRKMVLKFVREQYPQAKFKRIFDATADGWNAYDFHRLCDKKGWTLTIVMTTKNFIFGGFTTAEWESPWFHPWKPCPHSFLFSVDEGSKYPITSGKRTAIDCDSRWCARFGTNGEELAISSDSNKNTDSFWNANDDSFKLPEAKWNEGHPFRKEGL